jgi:hypothetical protein
MVGWITTSDSAENAQLLHSDVILQIQAGWITHSTYYLYYYLYYDLPHILSMAPHTTPYCIILSILFLSYTAIHINNIPSPVHAHTFQLASPPPKTSQLSSTSIQLIMGMPPHSFVLILTAMMKPTVVESGIMTVMTKLTVVESGTMETESTGKCLQKELLPSISPETWHPNSSTGNALSLVIQPQEQKKRPS